MNLPSLCKEDYDGKKESLIAMRAERTMSNKVADKSNNTFIPWDVKPSIFFHNVAEGDPKALAQNVDNELYYFKGFIKKALGHMDVERYGVNWEKDDRNRYTITPASRLRISKSKNMIILHINSVDYNPRVPLQRSNFEIVNTISHETDDDYVVLTLPDSETFTSDEILYYGRDEVSWERISIAFTGHLLYLTDKAGSKFEIIGTRTGTDHIIVDLDSILPKDTRLIIQNELIEYQEIPLNNISRTKFYDEKGRVSFRIVKHDQFLIETRRKIEGTLHDESNRSFLYDGGKSGGHKNAHMIVLKEPEDKYSSADAEEHSLLDMFFELLKSGFEFEVWERPDIKPGSTKGRIKVFKAFPEESRLLIAELPTSDIIFPPKNTHQLKMQLNAVETLMRRPAVAHRNLLKLFEPHQSAYWEQPGSKFTENTINWVVLSEQREGADQQKQFVLKSLNSPDFCILEGPPGSGKTTAISELIVQLISQKKRVLLSASTHVAIDNVIEKLEDHYRKSGGIEENGIVPVRIGREFAISEVLRKYQIDNKREKLSEQLNKERWFQEASEEEQRQYLDNFIIHSSNIVCGTTIGILQYPPFRERRWDYVIPEFDYLIIDEASKTTFQEFLVPAIYAKKWILVGDVHQLSPSADTLHVRINLDGLLTRSEEIAQLIFMKLIFGRNRSLNNRGPLAPLFLYVDSKSVIDSLYHLIHGKILEDKEKEKRRQRLANISIAFITNERCEGAEEAGIEIITSEKVEKDIYRTILFDIIIVESQLFDIFHASFPEERIMIYPNGPDVHEIDFRHDYYYNRFMAKYHKVPYEFPVPRGAPLSDPNEIKNEIYASLEKSWAGELAWRMKRVQELILAKNVKEQGTSVKYYHASMRSLLPEGESHQKIWSMVNKISHIAMTSILKSIQEGVTQYYREDEKKTALSHGIPNHHLQLRYESLTYQHRMHPEISRLPRTLFYHEKALKDFPGLSKGLLDWKYDRYDHRVVWIDVPEGKKYKNTNHQEALKILKELDAVIQHLTSTKYPERKGANPWEIIILSFYEKQRQHIRDLLRERYPENSEKETRFLIDGIEVKNYTVDKVQGREGDIVFISMVQTQRVGFMDSPNRLNVALTRAKYQLVIVGMHQFFKDQRYSWELQQIAKNIPLWNQQKSKK